MQTYDLAIVGLGAMGSATAFHASRAGLKVIGFDRFQPPHSSGSSHGLTRVIREAYFEDPAYVPLLQRAYPLWQALEAEWGEPLLELTGGLMIGPPDGELVPGCLASARQYRLPHEILTAAEVSGRYPAFELPETFAAVAEPRTGFLRPEVCIRAQLTFARQAGCRIEAPVQVLGWHKQAGDFVIRAGAEQYHARKLVLTAGAWLSRLVPELHLPLSVTRQALYWFAPREPERFALHRFPVFLIEVGAGRHLYGFPDIGEGFKVALHTPGMPIDPDTLPAQGLDSAELEDLRQLLARFLPAANGELRQQAVCMYTNTPDGHFWIDTHPDDTDLLLVSPCSGHGFKFSSVIGEEAARWVQGLPAGDDLSLFAARVLQ